MKLRIVNQDGKTEIRRDSPKFVWTCREVDRHKGPCWYQGSRSLSSSGEGKKSPLGPFVVAKTVHWKVKPTQRKSSEFPFFGGTY